MTWPVFARATFLLSVLVVSKSWAAYDLDEKFSELEGKLDLILDHLGIHTATNSTESPPPTEVDEESEPRLRPWVTLLQARRQPIGDQLEFTIEFKVGGRGLVRWTDEQNVEGVTYPIHDHPDIQEFSFTVRSSMYGAVDLLFYYQGNSSEMCHLELTLRKVSQENTTSELSLPIFGINPPEEFVYEQDRNMTIKLHLPAVNEPSEHPLQYTLQDKTAIHVMTFLLGQDGQIEAADPEPGMYHVLNIEDRPDVRLVTVELNTAQYQPRGYLTIKVVHIMNSDHSLDHHLSLEKEIAIREYSQATPLPEGFLSFTPQDWQPMVNGSIQLSCSTRVNCSLQCMPVGEDIAEFCLVRVGDDGSVTAMETHSGHFPIFHAVRVYQTTFTGPSEGTDHFECRVKDWQGRSAVQHFDMTYYVGLTILDGQAEIRVLNEHDTQPTRQLVLVCTVEGTPPINVSFSVRRRFMANTDLQPDQIVQHQDGRVTATKYLSYDSSELNGQTADAPVELARCNAHHGGHPWEFETFQLTLPEDIRT